jgi:hypothetical protein
LGPATFGEVPGLSFLVVLVPVMRGSARTASRSVG